MKSLKLIWLLGLTSSGLTALLPDLECPEECDCHYFRINWVTDCSENELSSVPTLEEGLSINVYSLDMNVNNLTEVETFPEDIKLRSLKMADNRLTKVTRDYFAGLGYLLDLDLSGNLITQIDPEAFMDSPGLITLELQMNPLDEVRGPFLISKSILNLDISGCNLGRINSAFFIDTPSLRTLDMSGNALEDLDNNVFAPLTSLQELKLNRCNLKVITSKTFSKLDDLKRLEMAENDFKGPIDWVNVLAPLGRLDYLDLRKSRISNLPDDLFESNPWLRSLILAENIIRDLDVATTLGQNLKHLDYLDLSSCKIEGPLSEQAFANATQLRTLILSGNAMSATDLAVALSPLTKLQKLSLRNCTLTRLPPNTFHKFSNLQELDVSYNPLNDAFTSLLNPLKSLLHLDMGYSNLGSIAKNTFYKMTSLKTLILSGNPLKKLESGLFQNLTDLETLELKNCGLARLRETVFHENFTYPDLEELYLTGNPLEIRGTFIPSQLNRLKTLDLGYCNVTYIPENALESFGNITSLSLKGNKLQYNDTNMNFLKNVPILEKLDLSFNNLSYINPNVFRFNSDLKSVKLVGNPWSCGCHISDMWEWAQVVKGDLNILPGSTVSTDNVAKTNPKRRNALVCHFDSTTPPIKRRKELIRTNRTWSRYVKESACDSSLRMSPTKLIAPPQALISEKTNKVMYTWLCSAALATIILITATIFVAYLKNSKAYTSQKRKNSNK